MFDFANTLIHILEVGIAFLIISFIAMLFAIPLAVKYFAARLAKSIVQEGVVAAREFYRR